MDIKKISYFVEVVKQKSFSQAARNLYISQPMLSKAIRQLEEEFGSQLLDRSSKHFLVTDVGKLFYEQSLRTLKEYSKLQHLLDEEEVLIQGEVSLSIPSVILSIFFAPVLSIIEEKYPHIRINLYEAGSYTVYENVFSGNADIGVVMMPVPMQDITAYPLFSDQCVLATSPDHPLAERKEVDFGELSQEKFIVFNDRFVLNDMILQACHSRGFSPYISYQSSLDSFILNMVSLNQGITIMPCPLIRNSSYDVRYMNIIPEIPWDVTMIVRKNHYLSHAAMRVFQTILDYFKQL